MIMIVFISGQVGIFFDFINDYLSTYIYWKYESVIMKET